MVPTRLLLLTRDEVMFATDRVRNDDRGSDEMPVSGYQLILKLAGLYLELVAPGAPPGATAALALTEAECWLLRSRFSSGDKTAADAMFGVRMLRKLYEALLSFNTDADMLPSSEGGDLAMTPERRAALHTFLEESDGQRRTDED